MFIVPLQFWFLKVIEMALPWSVPAVCSSCSVWGWWAGQPGLQPSMALCSSQPPPVSPARYTTPSTRYTWVYTHSIQTHWATCSIVTMNTHTGVYYDLVPHASSCCTKCSPEHQMWINKVLTKFPQKCTAVFLPGLTMFFYLFCFRFHFRFHWKSISA